MTWPSWAGEKTRIANSLSRHQHPLPGIAAPAALDCLATQFIASLRRESYYQVVQRGPIHPRRATW